MFFDEDQKGEKRKGGTSAARRVSSKARSGQMRGSASGDSMMVVDSPSAADGATGTERTQENHSVDSLTQRLERIELLNDHRDEFLLQCAQSRRALKGFLCRTWLVEGDVASFQSFGAAKTQGKAYSEAAKGQKGHQMGQLFMSVFAAFVNGLVTESPGGTGLAEVEVDWVNQFRKQLISASDVGRFLEMWNIRETHPRGGPVRTLVRYRMRTPDPALPEDAQNINKLAHILPKVLLHRKGTEQEGPAPPTNNERKIQSQLEHRRKRAEGKYIQWKTRLTPMKLTFRNRWQSRVLEKKMKSTRPSNELLFCMMATRMRVATLLLVRPSFFFSSLLRTLWLATVSITLEVDQCRARSFCCLDRMSWTVNTQSELKTVEKCVRTMVYSR